MIRTFLLTAATITPLAIFVMATQHSHTNLCLAVELLFIAATLLIGRRAWLPLFALVPKLIYFCFMALSIRLLPRSARGAYHRFMLRITGLDPMKCAADEGRRP